VNVFDIIDDDLVIHFLGGSVTGICSPGSCIDMTVITEKKCDLKTLIEWLKKGKLFIYMFIFVLI
jgi:hypothetical protein